MVFTNAVFEGDGRMEQGFLETFWQSTVVIKCTEHSSTGIALLIAPTSLWGWHDKDVFKTS